MDPVSVGLLGCGTISDTYLTGAAHFDSYEIVACADLDADRAAATAMEYDLKAHDPDGLLANESVEVVVNLTPPGAHAETTREALDAGKHVYVEKPFATTPNEATKILDAAQRNDRLVGGAPDTFLGAGIQTCRRVLDRGEIGDPVGATAVWVSGGHENWHPSPEFFYAEGGGPLLDMGPYYATALVSLLGSVERVAGSVTRAHEQRRITSEPRAGDTIDVDVPTHEAGVLTFDEDVTATITASFDAPGGTTFGSPAFEIYGTEGTLALPDPNHFDGPVEIHRPGDTAPERVSLTHEYTGGRGAGVADLARAIRGSWQHRTSGALAGHVLETLAGVRESSGGETYTIESGVDRPAPLSADFPSDDWD